MAEYIRQPKEFEQRIVNIKRVSKKTKGGDKMGFTALVVSGNKDGKVGYALGKAPDVSSAIKKGVSKAEESAVEVNVGENTIAHEIKHKFRGAEILLKPAPRGSGIIAGGVVRDVVELAGIKDISAKMLGSSNKQANVQCTIEALQLLKE